jgi:sugar phosphate isomerase/epimerase
MKRISIGSWTFSLGPYTDKPVPWRELLQRLKSLGFDGIEVGGFSIHPRPENQPAKEDREQIKQEAADIGMAFSSFIPNLWNEKLINTDDPSGYLREFRRGLEFASDIGAKALCIDTLQPPSILDELDYDTAKKRVVSVWKQCAKEAADKGCYMAWEFEPVYAFNKPTDVVRIVDEINEDNFGIAFDTCHAEMIARTGVGQWGEKELLEGGCLEFAQKLRGKINHIHLMDCDGIVHHDGSGSQRIFGEGVLNFDEIIPELNTTCASLEWWVVDPGVNADAWTTAERNKKRIDPLNQKYG